MHKCYKKFILNIDCIIHLLRYNIFFNFIYIFYIAMTYYIINKDNLTYLIILKYILKTNQIKTRLFELTKLIIAFKNIYDIKLS